MISYMSKEFGSLIHFIEKTRIKRGIIRKMPENILTAALDDLLREIGNRSDVIDNTKEALKIEMFEHSKTKEALTKQKEVVAGIQDKLAEEHDINNDLTMRPGRLTRDQKGDLKLLKRQHQELISRLERKEKEACEDLRVEHENEIRELKESHRLTVEDLEVEIESLKTDKIQKLEKEIAEYKAKYIRSSADLNNFKMFKLSILNAIETWNTGWGHYYKESDG